MDKKILRGNRTLSSEFTNQLENSIEDRLTLMDIEASLKVSFLGGLVEVKILCLNFGSQIPSKTCTVPFCARHTLPQILPVFMCCCCVLIRSI